MAISSQSDDSHSPGDINPYAAPQHYVERRPNGAEVGAWRDGPYLVLHEDAQLPPICVRTGAPAECFYWHSISWSYPIDLCSRTMRLDVPLTRQAREAFFSGRRRLLLGVFAPLGLAGLLLGTAMLWQADDIPLPIALVLLGFILLGAFLGALAISRVAIPDLLWFKRARRGCLWLGGADERFLDQLPTWTKS